MQVKVTVMLEESRGKDGVILERVVATELDLAAAASLFRESAEAFMQRLQTPAKSGAARRD